MYNEIRSYRRRGDISLLFGNVCRSAGKVYFLSFSLPRSVKVSLCPCPVLRRHTAEKAAFFKIRRLSGEAVSMLDYTKMAIKQTISDLKKTDYIRNVATQIIYIIYLIYTLIVGTATSP